MYKKSETLGHCIETPLQKRCQVVFWITTLSPTSAPRMLEEKYHLPRISAVQDDVAAFAQVQAFAEKVMGTLQLHRCFIPSCGKLPGGRTGCRFAMPRAAGTPLNAVTRPVRFRLQQKEGGVAVEVVGWGDGFRATSGQRAGPGSAGTAGVVVDASGPLDVHVTLWEVARPNKRDGRVVETNPLLSYAFACNTNVQHLGAKSALVALVNYVVGYCAKNPIKLGRVLGLVRQVMKEVEAHPVPLVAGPRAEDAGNVDLEAAAVADATRVETARLLKRLVGAIDRKVEISSQMAAMSLLGYPSWHASHKFVVVNPWQYVTSLPMLFQQAAAGYADLSSLSDMLEEGWTSGKSTDLADEEAASNCRARGLRSLAASVVEEGWGESEERPSDLGAVTEAGEWLPGLGDESPVGDERVDPIFVASEGAVPLDEEDADNGYTIRTALAEGAEDSTATGVFVVHRFGRKHLIGVPAAYNYAYRGPALRDLCALEYAMLFEIVKTEGDEPEDPSTCEAGRPRNARFPFHRRHKLAGTDYKQKLVSQLRCPIMAGKRLPKFPGEVGADKARRVWAAYVATLLIPWNAEEPPVCTWEAVRRWEVAGGSSPVSECPYVHRARCALVQRLKMEKDVDRAAKVVADVARQRWRKVWGVAHPLDLAFSKKEEEEAARRTREEGREARFAQALDEIALAVEKEIQTAASMDPREGDVQRTLRTMFPLSESLQPAPGPSRDLLWSAPLGFGQGDSDAGDEEAAAVRGHLSGVYNAWRAEVDRTDVVQPTAGVVCVLRDVGSLLRAMPTFRVLDEYQEAVVKSVVEYVALEAVSDDTAKPPAPLLFVHAGPGTGKSATAAEIHDRLSAVFGRHVMMCIAPTGVAAANLQQGSTCHHAVALTVYSGDSSEGAVDFVAENKDVLHRMRQRFKGCKVVVIDEASMVRCEMLRDIDRRLRQITERREVVFGGLAVVLMGDFVQLPPIGGGDLFVDPKAGGGSGSDVRRLSALEGHALFKHFTVVELRGQHRAQDPEHLASVNAFRSWTKESMLTRQAFIDRLRYLSEVDVTSDSSWSEAVIVSTDRKTVHYVNETRARQFAYRTGNVFVTWRLPPQTQYAGRVPEATLETIYAMVKDMRAIFVKDAPATITFNVRPERGLSNGTRCRLHSLVLAEEEPEESRLSLQLARPGQCLVLRHPPFAVIVALPRTAVVAPAFGDDHGVVVGAGWTDGDEILVPLLPTMKKVSVARYLHTKTCPTLGVMAHPYDLLFATTYHGVQCRTVPKIVLCVDHPASPALTYNAFYVGISRVARTFDIRLLEFAPQPSPVAAARRLRSLVPRVLLVQYMMKLPTYNKALTYLERTFAAVGISYSKRGPDRVMEQVPSRGGSSGTGGRGSERSFGARGGGVDGPGRAGRGRGHHLPLLPCRKRCGATFNNKSHRVAHETTCGGGDGTSAAQSDEAEPQHACRYGCGRAWRRAQDCKNHERHCHQEAAATVVGTPSVQKQVCFLDVFRYVWILMVLFGS